MNHKAYIKSKASGTVKHCKEITSTKTRAHRGFPDLTEFRKSIRYKGDSLTKTVIKGRG